jgi:restriction endonuclease Mrr
MNQQPAPYRASSLKAKALIGLALAAIAVAGACALPVVAVLAAHNNTGAAFLFGVIGCVLIAYALWLLVSARRASAAEEQQQASQRQHAVHVAAKEYVAHLERISVMQSLLSLTRKDFESAIVELLKFWGHTHVRRTGRGGDIICRNAAGALTVVHCKPTAPDILVKPGEVETFMATVAAHHAEQGVFVTTAGYSESAQALGKKHGIRIIDGTELVAHMQGMHAAKEESRTDRV